ncbi:YqiA/YcfP family alpha/beta fold hydrolase [Thiomicrorhabdus cannonii]|uniref:YqiA/YcfP family alpha/beta fold hydrolase n=1 Tax=Thiomicrorhabdus cannonii TaxID=2748011 RepID=UPI0015BB9DAD|nr:YqiA/YcfP family alpha/beta fold hydrolase [Thiomicrorhabdus cannonii]
MQTMQCVYLHGFLSNAQSQKSRWFERRFSHPLVCEAGTRQIELLTPSYPQTTPDSSVAYLQNFMHRNGLDKQENPVFLIGSSLGGFYAQYLGLRYRLPYLLINPALDPVALLEDYLGQHRNPYTQEEFTVDAAYRQQLSAYYTRPQADTKGLLLLDKGDEIINYEQAFELYQTGHANQQTVLFEGGDHTFVHLEESWQTIQEWICRL